MSGGSYDYAYFKVEEFARSLRCNTPQRKAFRTLCDKVAKAMHDIEWVDSCDYGEGDDIKAINAALGTDGPSLVLSEVISDARKASDALVSYLASMTAETQQE